MCSATSSICDSTRSSPSAGQTPAGCRRRPGAREHAAARLAGENARVVGVPKTMDTDLSVTDYCIGFDSAVSVVTEALDRLHTTATSHHRVMVCEVMGRDTGWVAVMGGLAGGADLIIIPEFPVAIDDVVEHLDNRRAKGS